MGQGYFCGSIIVLLWRHFTICSIYEYFSWNFFNGLVLTLANTRCWLLSKLSHFVLTPSNPRCRLLGAFLYYIIIFIVYVFQFLYCIKFWFCLLSLSHQTCICSMFAHVCQVVYQYNHMFYPCYGDESKKYYPVGLS